MRIFSLLLAAVLLLGGGIARAEPTDPSAAEAERHWTAGMAHFRLDEYDAAVKEWEAGFRAKPSPQFLYNIAQAYRLSKQYDKALSFYKKYLYMQPDAPNRAEVENHIAVLTKLVSDQQAVATSPPVQPLPSQETKSPEPPAVPTAPAAAPESTTPAPNGASAALTARAPGRTPITKKGWFWGVIGGAVAVVAAGVVVGVLLGTADSTKTLPAVRF
jgi:tetratricopeptide (TPR) repeat protein